MAYNLVELKKHYDDHGWIKVENLITPEIVASVVDNIEKFYQKNKDLLQPREINFSEDKINSIHCLHKYENDFFKGVQATPKIQELVTALLKDKPEWRGSEAFLKPAGKGLPSPMHQDDFYWCVGGHNALTIWIALDNVDSSNGGVNYYDGSHKLGLLDHEDSFAPGSSQKVKDSIIKECTLAKVCPTLKPGDALIHHALTIHGSDANTSPNSRRAMTLQFKASGADYDLDRKRFYENRLQEQIKSRSTKDS